MKSVQMRHHRESQNSSRPKEKLHPDRFDDNDEAVRTLLDEKRKACTDWQNYTDWQNPPNCVSPHNRYRDCQPRARRELCCVHGRRLEQKTERVHLCVVTVLLGPSVICVFQVYTSFLFNSFFEWILMDSASLEGMV